MSAPWVDREVWGDAENVLGGVKLMVLGECYYNGSVSVAGKGRNAYVVDALAVKSYARLSGNLTQMIAGRPWSQHLMDERKALWSAIAFYNYVPLSVGDAPGQRPTEEMWAVGAEALPAVIRSLGPEAVIVRGDATWRHLWKDWQGEPPGTEERQPHDDAYEDVWTRQAGKAVFLYMKHPSGSRGFSPARWGPAVSHLLARRSSGKGGA